MKTKKRLILALAFALPLIVPPPAHAQPPRFMEAAKAIYAQAQLSAGSSDDARRAATIALAEQMAFEFPGQGWGAKTAGDGRPISKDCVARVGKVDGNKIVNGVCYDWINGSTGAVQDPPIVNDIPGQIFVPVVARDHLGGGGGGGSGGGGSGGGDTSALEARVKALEERVAALEKGGGGGGGGGTSDPAILAILKEQLDTTRAILDLLKKTASRFGVQ